MAITVTEDWRREQKSLAAPWTATKVYIVTGTTDADSALTATGVPQVDSPLMAGSPLKCAGPRIQEHAGLDYWVIACDYAIPDKGTFDTQRDDPLDNPVVYRWEQIDVVELVDQDVDGKAMTNSAGDLYEPVQRTMSYDRLTVFRNEPWFDVAKAIAFRNGVNETGITLGGIPVAAEHLRCSTISPAQEYSPDAPFVRMMYAFDVMFDSVTWGLYPWQHRMLDIGTSGWYTVAAARRKGRLVDTKGGVVAPQRLDGTGKTISSYIKVKDEDSKTLYATENSPVGEYTSPYATEDKISSGGGYYRIYKKCRLVNFASLGL